MEEYIKQLIEELKEAESIFSDFDVHLPGLEQRKEKINNYLLFIKDFPPLKKVTNPKN
jgi:hypothetical protein